MLSPRSREESAAAIPEICHSLSSRYAEIASVARYERERAMKEGSGGFHAARKSEEEGADFGCDDHADWMRRSSRMLDEDGHAGRGVAHRAAPSQNIHGIE
jgi:hypothetical protein